MTRGLDERPHAPPRHLPSPPELGSLSQASLFLDFDGTLVEIASSPDAIRPAADLHALLAALAERWDGRIAIVSGRSLSDLDRYLSGTGVTMAGSHGIEVRMAGGEAQFQAKPIPAIAEAEMRAFAAAREGLLVESKPFGVAMHYRHAPEQGPAVLALAESLSASLGAAIKRGKMVVELMPRGCDKGSAVARLMDQVPFEGSQPIFLGDDVTDEDGFAAVLGYGGGGILVGPNRETAARWRLPGVTEVYEWIRTGLA